MNICSVIQPLRQCFNCLLFNDRGVVNQRMRSDL